MANKKSLKQLGYKQSLNPAPVGGRDSWKDKLNPGKEKLSMLKKKKKR